jgi:RNA polymerase sigma factor (sigma-70 family)
MPPQTDIHKLLVDLQDSSDDAKAALLDLTCERLRRLASRMLKNYPRLKRWSDTDEVLQAATLRLYKALSSVKPETPEQYFGLAATQIRRELIDLTRHFYGPEGLAANHHSDSGKILTGTANPEEPAKLVEWESFHESVDALPKELKMVVEQLWYNGLTQTDAAEVLGISLATLKRRWTQARLLLADSIQEDSHDGQ